MFDSLRVCSGLLVGSLRVCVRVCLVGRFVLSLFRCLCVCLLVKLFVCFLFACVLVYLLVLFVCVPVYLFARLFDLLRACLIVCAYVCV